MAASDYTVVYNYKNVINDTLELKYYEYSELIKNYLKFYNTLESKYYQNVKEFVNFLKLTDTFEKKYYK